MLHKPSIAVLSEMPGVSEEEFHRHLKYLVKNNFKTELRMLGIRDPDVLLDDQGIVYLADPRNQSNLV